MSRFWQSLNNGEKITLIALIATLLTVPPAWLALRQPDVTAGPNRPGPTTATLNPTTPPVSEMPTTTEKTAAPTTTLSDGSLVKKWRRLSFTDGYGLDLVVFKVVPEDESDVYFTVSVVNAAMQANEGTTLSLLDQPGSYAACRDASRYSDTVDIVRWFPERPEMRKGTEFCLQSETAQVVGLLKYLGSNEG